MHNPINAAIEIVVQQKLGLDHPYAEEMINRYKTLALSLQKDGSKSDREAYQKMMQDLLRDLNSIQ